MNVVINLLPIFLVYISAMLCLLCSTFLWGF
uniref:Uncharacterized protein n=1 Tax=Arundo donax TaxID=35708 RepID=A0A0A8ZPE4_ARUDO